jgi:hypothetical protein
MPRMFSVRIRKIALVLCLCLTANSMAVAAQRPMDATTAKQKVQAHKIGGKVRITESDGSEVTGKVASIDANTFQVQPKSGSPIQISFSNVKAVHGGGLSTAAKIGIGVGIGVGIAIIVIAIEVKTHPLKIGPIL